MKAFIALCALAMSSAATATCYMIYTPANELVWRGTSPPVAMDKLAIDAAVHRIVPRGHLIVSGNDAVPCRPLDLTVPRKTLRQRVAEAKNE